MAKRPLTVDTLTHDEASRKNAPTAELEPFVPAEVKTPIQVAYERRNRDLDPQLVWRGKDMADWSDLIVEAPPLYIQEKIHPKALIEDLKRSSERRREPEDAPDLFADFNGIKPDQRTEFYAHDQHWSNRMILGDGLKVMASLAEREGLKGQVQCIYIDPPYGIKFNSNFQWSTTSRDVKDGKADHLTREPEQVKAFRDTWADGIHSYLTYLRDRLTVARDLLANSGSIFVQINEDNLHRVRTLLDEVFGNDNFISQISFVKTMGQTDRFLSNNSDFILWFAKEKGAAKYRNLLEPRSPFDNPTERYVFVEPQLGEMYDLSVAQKSGQAPIPNGRILKLQVPFSQTGSETSRFKMEMNGRLFLPPGTRGWSTSRDGMDRMKRGGYLHVQGNGLWWKSYRDTYPYRRRSNAWDDTRIQAFLEDRVYVVQTASSAIKNCILMTTDPGDLVLDPTCGSGTTAYVAEQWGRRWITIDTSRVALALARARIMGARYPWYLLADSREGQMKEAEVTRSLPADTPVYGRLRQGFVYKRVPHITLKSIANNAEIDTIWEKYQEKLEPLRTEINALRRHLDLDGSLTALEDGLAKGKDGAGPSSGQFKAWEEWEIPREIEKVLPPENANAGKYDRYPAEKQERDHIRTTLINAHTQWWEQRIARQKEIDASIAAKADTEYLYDQPYEEKARVRVAGPFTVESLSPHRVPAIDVDDSLFDEMEAAGGRRQPGAATETVDFAAMVLDNLKRSGVQQAHKADRLVFTSLKPWPGRFICAEGAVRQASEGDSDTLADSPTRRAAIFVGPEYGTVARADLTAAAREAMEAGFDLLIAASFNFDAHASEFDRMGALTVLQARINPDLHMPDLANTGAGNLFTVFGEPDIAVHDEEDGCISIEVAGVDMYKGGEIVSGDADDIAVWFIDTDYNYESFFVRHAYFPGANDPYKALKTTLKAEIDADPWESLKRTRSRPFPRPAGGKVAVKVINHLGDEVMKVVGV